MSYVRLVVRIRRFTRKIKGNNAIALKQIKVSWFYWQLFGWKCPCTDGFSILYQLIINNIIDQWFTFIYLYRCVVAQQKRMNFCSNRHYSFFECMLCSIEPNSGRKDMHGWRLSFSPDFLNAGKFFYMIILTLFRPHFRKFTMVQQIWSLSVVAGKCFVFRTYELTVFDWVWSRRQEERLIIWYVLRIYIIFESCQRDWTIFYFISI